MARIRSREAVEMLKNPDTKMVGKYKAYGIVRLNDRVIAVKYEKSEEGHFRVKEAFDSGFHHGSDVDAVAFAEREIQRILANREKNISALERARERLKRDNLLN